MVEEYTEMQESDDMHNMPDWLIAIGDAYDSEDNDTVVDLNSSETGHLTLPVRYAHTALAAATAAGIWQTALLAQRYTQFGLEAVGAPAIVATAIASLITEPVAAAIGSFSFMPGIQGATPGFTTAVISWALYTLVGGVGHGQLGRLARNNTDSEYFGAYADVSLVPAIVALESVALAHTEGAYYRANNNQGDWWERFRSGTWDRMATGGAMRLIANISALYISNGLNDYAAHIGYSELESGQPANQIISNLPSVAVALIPNLSGYLETRWNRLSLSIHNILSNTHINSRSNL